MRRSLIALAAAALVLVSFPVRSPALDASSLWPKLLQIIQKVEALEQQNKEILQNQQRILEELEELRGTIEREPEPPPPSGGERSSAP